MNAAMLAVLLCAARPTLQTENPYLAKAVAQLEALDEAEALHTLEKARAWPKNTPDDLALVHYYLGFAHAGLNHGRQAVEAFASALLLRPSLELPDDASPRIREWWVKAGGKVEPPPAAVPVPVPAPAPPPPEVKSPEPAPPAAVTPPPVVEQPLPHRSRTLGIVGLVVGVAVAGAGGIMLGSAESTESAYRAQQPGQPAALMPTVSRHDAATAQVLFDLSLCALAVGGVLAALGILDLVW